MKESKVSTDDAKVRNHAEALVQAVDDVAQEFSKQIEAQASHYVRKSQMLQLLRSNKLGNKVASASFNHSLSPFPSDQKCRVHPAIKWDMRAEELMLVQATGTPVNKPISPGEQWFIIDATWFKHWIGFVASSRRRAPPGPIDNLWMINPLTEKPYEHMIEDTDENVGDFRRVPPQIWQLFEVWYGGGPAISVIGPPTEDTRRWVVHIEEKDDGSDSRSVVELMGELDHPEDIIRVGKEKNEAHLVVDLHHGTRRPSVAEMSLLAKVGGFHDGGKDHIDTGLDAIVDSEDDSEEEDQDDKASMSGGGGSVHSDTKYAKLTQSALAFLDNGDDDKEDEADDKKQQKKSESKAEAKKTEGTKKVDAEHPKSTEVKQPQKKRSSIFGR